MDQLSGGEMLIRALHDEGVEIIVPLGLVGLAMMPGGKVIVGAPGWGEAKAELVRRGAGDFRHGGVSTMGGTGVIG